MDAAAAPSLAQLAMLASIIVAMSTVSALLWGVWTYRQNAKAQVQLLALGALQRYLDLAVAHPGLASRRDDQPVDAAYAWFAAHALVTAQILWTLVGHDAGWQRSIRAIVRQHGSFLRSEAFVATDFDPTFVAWLRRQHDS